MGLFQRKKNNSRYHSILVRRVRQQAEPVRFKKKTHAPKLFLQNIKTKFFAEYKYVILGVLVIILLGGGFGFIFFSHFFDVDHIIVERTELITNTTPIQQLLDSYQGKNILLISSGEVEFNIVKSFPEIKTITVSKLLPRTLKVKVVEYEIIARIRGVDQTKEMYLNEIGMVRDIPTKNEKLPLIEYKTTYDLQGDETLVMIASYLTLQDRNRIMRADELQTILSAKSTFETEFDMPVTQLKYYPLEQEIHLKTNRNFYLWLDLSVNLELQLAKLKTALRDFNIYKMELSYIDLRISNKIIYCTKNTVCTAYANQ